MTDSWLQDRWLAFDTETTGVDCEQSLILSIAAIKVTPGTWKVETRHWFLNWDVPIPPESQRIHGLSQEWLAANGRDPRSVLEPLVPWLGLMLQKQATLVGMNCTFDLTILDRNCRRLGIPTLSDEMGDIRPVIDVFVLDKYVDPFRKGKRNLEALAEHYKVPWDGQAHDAAADALISARVAYRIGRLYPQLASIGSGPLHQLQIEAKAKQDASYAAWRAKQPDGGQPRASDGHWPIFLKQEAQ